MTEYAFLQFPAEAVQVDPKIVEALPGSAQRVLEAIRTRGPLTHNELGQATGLPPRTIRYAVRRLKDEGVLDSLSSLRDCRTCYFFVSRKHISPGAIEEARSRAEAASKEGRLVERVSAPVRRPIRPTGFGMPTPLDATPAAPSTFEAPAAAADVHADAQPETPAP